MSELKINKPQIKMAIRIGLFSATSENFCEFSIRSVFTKFGGSPAINYSKQRAAKAEKPFERYSFVSKSKLLHL